VSETIDLKAVERRAYLSYHQDGPLDLLRFLQHDSKPSKEARHDITG